jgi:spore maturation protein CgeB
MTDFLETDIRKVPPLRIAYIGCAYENSLLWASALERLGHKVVFIDPSSWLGKSKWVLRWLFHAGGLGIDLIINKRLFEEVQRVQPDLIWVIQGEFLGPKCLKRLRMIGVPIVNYTTDNPFGPRDGLRFYYYRRAVSFYDYFSVPRLETLHDLKLAEAKRVERFYLSADEIAHAPRTLTLAEQSRFGSDVAFIGTWMPERGPFMAKLISLGVSISIWGDRWHKASEWGTIRPYWRGPGIYDSKSYSAAVLASKICIGLLSKENRDLHTSRSMEIPHIGGLLCAERTSEHIQLYEEGIEAVFWEDAEECAEICKDLLTDETRRLEISKKGYDRALRNNHFNEVIFSNMLHKIMTAVK